MWVGESLGSRKTSLETVAVGKVRDDWDLDNRVCFEDLEKEGVMRAVKVIGICDRHSMGLKERQQVRLHGP